VRRSNVGDEIGSRLRVLLWHGWLLEGTGSNVYTARVAEDLASRGHDVALVCQESHPERYAWIDAVGSVGEGGVGALSPNAARTRPGRCVLFRPEIGRVLPVFVVDEYEGFEVARFVDLGDDELERYLAANVAALRAAAAWHRPDVVIAGHAVPGSVVARRALGSGSYLVKIHGSDVEYAMRPQRRYRDLAREGLLGATAVVGASRDVLRRCAELVPGMEAIAHVVHPGVDAGRFRPRERREALTDAADRLDLDAGPSQGRPRSLDAAVANALAGRDAAALDELTRSYDQTAPDPDAASVLRRLASTDRPLAGYFGKLIPQKGVDLLLAALTRSSAAPDALVIGFGLERERLTALWQTLRTGDVEALAWLLASSDTAIVRQDVGAVPARSDASFVGRLDHRYAPDALAALDVLVVPSVLDEAFGMVAAEGAAAGALPLVARHSGLAEIAEALESHVGRPGAFSFEPGPGAAGGLAAGIDRLLEIPEPARRELGASLASFVRTEWSWRATADRLVDLARRSGGTCRS
jgi:glycosyltransferase involved in cell wall biosynthesis